MSGEQWGGFERNQLEECMGKGTDGIERGRGEGIVGTRE